VCVSMKHEVDAGPKFTSVDIELTRADGFHIAVLGARRRRASVMRILLRRTGRRTGTRPSTEPPAGAGKEAPPRARDERLDCSFATLGVAPACPTRTSTPDTVARLAVIVQWMTTLPLNVGLPLEGGALVGTP